MYQHIPRLAPTCPPDSQRLFPNGSRIFQERVQRAPILSHNVSRMTSWYAQHIPIIFSNNSKGARRLCSECSHNVSERPQAFPWPSQNIRILCSHCSNDFHKLFQYCVHMFTQKFLGMLSEGPQNVFRIITKLFHRIPTSVPRNCTEVLTSVPN